MAYTFDIYLTPTKKILVYDASEDNDTKELMNNYYEYFLNGIFGFYGDAVIIAHKPIDNAYTIDICTNSNNKFPDLIIIASAVKHYYEKYNTTKLNIVVNNSDEIKDNYECRYDVNSNQVLITNKDIGSLLNSFNKAFGEEALGDDVKKISDDSPLMFVSNAMNIGKFTANIESFLKYINN